MVLKGFVKSREQASSILMTGNVFVDNKRVEKPGQQVSQNSKIEIKKLNRSQKINLINSTDLSTT